MAEVAAIGSGTLREPSSTTHRSTSAPLAKGSQEEALTDLFSSVFPFQVDTIESTKPNGYRTDQNFKVVIIIPIIWVTPSYLFVNACC